MERYSPATSVPVRTPKTSELLSGRVVPPRSLVGYVRSGTKADEASASLNVEPSRSRALARWRRVPDAQVHAAARARGLRRCRVDAGHECDGYRHLSADRQREPFTQAPFASAFSSWMPKPGCARVLTMGKTPLNDVTPEGREPIDSSSSQKIHAVAFGHLRRSLDSRVPALSLRPGPSRTASRWLDSQRLRSHALMMARSTSGSGNRVEKAPSRSDPRRWTSPRLVDDESGKQEHRKKRRCRMSFNAARARASPRFPSDFAVHLGIPAPSIPHFLLS